MQPKRRGIEYLESNTTKGRDMKMNLMALGLVTITLIASGCGIPENRGGDSSREDAKDTRQVDKTAPEVTAFNNNFPNVAHKCDGHGHRIFVTTHNGKPMIGRLIIMADPSCKGYTAEVAAAAATAQSSQDEVVKVEEN